MLVHMLRTALEYDDGPIALRYPRGEGLGVPLPDEGRAVPIGTGEILREAGSQATGRRALSRPAIGQPDLSGAGPANRVSVPPGPSKSGRTPSGSKRVALIGYGSGVGKALEAADELVAAGIAVTVADARFAKPIDAGLMAQLAAEHDLLVTVEEGVLAGGFGSAVWETLNDAGATGMSHTASRRCCTRRWDSRAAGSPRESRRRSLIRGIQPVAPARRSSARSVRLRLAKRPAGEAGRFREERCRRVAAPHAVLLRNMIRR
jgi:deoxyxylulose-5-phosphate synthase